MKKLKQFFWLCSGANIALLNQCHTEGSKYVGIGATVFFTGIFAALAGAYALYTVFDNYWIAMSFGLIWGLMIFNLDRFIVSSMRKHGNVKKEFYMAIPRLILAVLISLVIAKPLEMKIFEKEILVEFDELERQKYTTDIDDIQMHYAEDKSTIQSEISALKEEINLKTADRDELRRLAQEEADGTGGSMRRNAGPIYKIKKQNADRVESELDAYKETNEQLIARKYVQLNELDSLMAMEIAGVEKTNLLSSQRFLH